MITIRNVSKAYRTHDGWNHVLNDVSLEIAEGEKIGILGLNGSGKSTLLRLICGVESPDSGEIIKNVRTSWPIGFSGGFVPSLTGRDNTRFIARIYGANPYEIENYVNDFSELESYFDEPIRTYSAGMSSRLNFAVSMAMRFDCYLVDEGTATGDRRFREKYKEAFKNLQEDASLIMVSHQAQTILEYCKSVAVLHNSKLTYYDDVKQGLEVYNHVGKDEKIIINRPLKVPKIL